MATVTRSKRRAPEYLPTLAEIEAAKAELDAKRLAAFEAGEPVYEGRIKTPKSIAEQQAGEKKTREASRLRMQRKRAAKANRELLQSDQPEPLDLDEHRDPRQTEQWLPVPTADDDEPKALNYYAINARTVARVPVDADGPQEMSALDIANVELLTTDDLVDCVSLPLDASDLQHRIDDIVGRWGLGPIDPTKFDVRGDYDPNPKPRAAKAEEPAVIPFKTVLKPKRFRSSV